MNLHSGANICATVASCQDLEDCDPNFGPWGGPIRDGDVSQSSWTTITATSEKGPEGRPNVLCILHISHLDKIGSDLTLTSLIVNNADYTIAVK